MGTDTTYTASLLTEAQQKYFEVDHAPRATESITSMETMTSVFEIALKHEREGRRDLALDVLWDSLGVAAERLGFSWIARSFNDLADKIEDASIEPEPFVLLGALMITLPIKEVDCIKKPRVNLFRITSELFDEWEWDKEELMDME